MGLPTRSSLRSALAAPASDDLHEVWDISAGVQELFANPEGQEIFRRIDFGYLRQASVSQSCAPPQHLRMPYNEPLGDPDSDPEDPDPLVCNIEGIAMPTK